MNIVWCMIVRNVLVEEDIGVFMKIKKHYGEDIMTEKRFTLIYLEEDTWSHEWDIKDNEKNEVIYQHGQIIVDLLNTLAEENEQLKQLMNKYEIDSIEKLDQVLFNQRVW